MSKQALPHSWENNNPGMASESSMSKQELSHPWENNNPGMAPASSMSKQALSLRLNSPIPLGVLMETTWSQLTRSCIMRSTPPPKKRKQNEEQISKF